MNRVGVLILLLSVISAGCAHGEQADAARAPKTQPASAVDGLVRGQVEDHFLLDPGMEGLEDFVVEIHVTMNADGSIQSAKIEQSGDSGDPNWKQFAQACLRAVLKSSPLEMSPHKPYESWKTMTVVFRARELATL